MEMNRDPEWRRWFNKGYAHLWIYLRTHSGLDIPCEYKTGGGFELGKWIKEIRIEWNQGLLPTEYERKLESIGLSKESKTQNWESMYRLASIDLLEKGELSDETVYRNRDGVLIGGWIDRQRKLYYSLSREQQEKLKDIGIAAKKTH